MAIKENAWLAQVFGRWRVGCKRSTPNPENAPPVKKKRIRENARKILLVDQDQHHQKIEELPDWEVWKNEAIADFDISVSAKENLIMSVSAQEDNSHLSDSWAQYDTSRTQFSAEGDEYYLQDSCSQHNTPEGSSKNEGASNVESLVDKWVCRDCKASAISNTAFPCCHICACWDCEFKMDSCPICGVAKMEKEDIPDWDVRKNEAAADIGLSVSAKENMSMSVSAEEGNSYLPDSWTQYDTSRTQFSAEGDDYYLQDSCPQHNTPEASTKNEGASSVEPLVDKSVCRDCKAAADSSAAFPCCHICECWDSEFDSSPICGVARTDGFGFSAKGGSSHLPDSSQDNTNGAHLSADGGDSHLPDSPRYNTNGTQFSAEGGDSNIPDLCPQYNTAEGNTMSEEAYEAESKVDRWACRICKAAAVSVVVLPCSHLCLCWECESEVDSCPICGEAKADCFYIRTA